MLVLTRRDGEQIIIGNDIVLTVVESHRDGVRIGIEAPRTTKIRRGELLNAQERQAILPAEQTKNSASRAQTKPVSKA